MNAPSGKTLALWTLALAGWLGASAVLGALGVASAYLLILHLVALGVVLWQVARNTAVDQASGFLVAYDQGPMALAPYAGAAAWVSGFGTVGIVAAILVQGPDAFALVVGLVGGLAIASMLMAPALGQSGATSLPEWVAWRFGRRAGRGAKGVFILWGVAVIAMQMAFAALVGQAMFGASPVLLLPILAALVLFAMLGGGMRTMIPAQAVLCLVLLVGVLVPALWLGISETGIVVPHLAPGALLHESAVAEARLGLIEKGDPSVATMLGLTALLGTLALPHTLVRWPAERDGRAARYFSRRSIVLAAVVVAAMPLFAIVVRAGQLFAALGGVPLPANLTSAEAVASGIQALDPPGWLLAALGGGVLAAIVAACASAALLAVTAMGEGSARETAGGVLSRLRWTGALTVIAGTGGVALLPVDPVTAFSGLLAFTASALFVPLVLGLLWQGMTTPGAVSGSLAGSGACIVLAALGWGVMDGIALWGVAVSILVSVAVSLVGNARHPSPPGRIPPVG